MSIQENNRNQENNGNQDQNKNQNQEVKDWELSEDFYCQDGNEKELNLEDFISDSSEDLSGEDGFGLDPASEVRQKVERIAEDVRRVTELSGQGLPAEQIAAQLGVEASYVADIMVCVQSFPEDDPIAVAHLMMME